MLIQGIEERVLVCDLEANGLVFDADKIWCIAAIDFESGEEFFWEPDRVKEGLYNLYKAKKIVFHNFYGYDRVLIKKLYPKWEYRDADDTFIMSSLFDADREIPKGAKGSHSIEAWGLRFGMHKPEHEDWTQYSEEMKHRCLEDTRIGVRVYKSLLAEKANWDWSSSLSLEYKVAKIHGMQMLWGVGFDKNRARSVYAELKKEIDRLEKEIYSQLPLKPVQIGSVPVKRPFKKDGSYTKMVEEYLPELNGDVVGPFTRIEWTRINIDSPDQIKDYLLSQGWEPDTWNYKKDGKFLAKDEDGSAIKTSPKLTESSFHSVKGDVPKLITKRMILKHRIQMIFHTRRDGTKTGWVNNLRSDGRIEAGGVTCGTPTGRYQHRGVVNVPKPTKKDDKLVFNPEEQNPIYGTHLRHLFVAEKPYVMVGCDAVSLETTVQGHYVYNRTNGKRLAESLLDETFKEDLAVTMGKPWKEAKSGYYALLYGAQPPKFSSTLGVPLSEGKKILEAFWRDNPGLKELKDDLERAFDRNYNKRTGRGFIKGLDGRKLWARSKHSLMNLLFQNAGSVIVKTATWMVFEKAQELGLDFKQVIHYHDEIEYEVHERDADRMMEVLEWGFNQAGKYWNLNLEIKGDPVVGSSWAEVH